MKILDKHNNRIEQPDLEKGRLKNDRIFVKHHDAIEGVAEKGHWNTVAEYPNGGKDVEWIVDVPGIAAKEAWDEFEDILRYEEYTEEELVELSKPTVEERLISIEQKLETMIKLLSGKGGE